MPMWWEQSGTWKETDELFVWSSSAWQRVRQCWIWTGSAWASCHVDPASLDSVFISDTGALPTDGDISVSWTYTAAIPGDWYIKIEASFSGGAYLQVATNVALTSSPWTGSVNGLVGFTTLNSTDFRVSMILDVDDTTNAEFSPQVLNPPYPT
jgi:hypothetical protein